MVLGGGSSSSSFSPDLKLFTPLATSPITLGSLPAPKMIRTMSRMRTTCQIPMLISRSSRKKMPACRAGGRGARLWRKTCEVATPAGRSAAGRVDEKVAAVQLDLDLLADRGLDLAGLADLDAAAVGEPQAQQVDRPQIAPDQHLRAQPAPRGGRGPATPPGRTIASTAAPSARPSAGAVPTGVST